MGGFLKSKNQIVCENAAMHDQNPIIRSQKRVHAVMAKARAFRNLGFKFNWVDGFNCLVAMGA